MNPPNPPTRHDTGPTRLELQARLAELELEREQLRAQKRRNILLFGAAVSLLVHISVLWYLDLIRQKEPGGPVGDSAYIEFAVLPEEELTQLEQLSLEVETPQSLSDLSEMPNVEADLELETPPAAELEANTDGAQPTLGGGVSGGDGDMNLGGTGTGVQFFETRGEGTRFAFIIDRSSSMAESNKLRIALGEVARAVDSLPDFASFHVLLFSSANPSMRSNDGVLAPPWQQGWTRARPQEVNRLISWLDSVAPSGGTQPVPAFARALSLDIPPDVVFFLTDGQIPQESPTLIADMNRRGCGVVINTIAFGDPGAQDLLKKIAEQSGGMYRFVPVRGP